MRSLILMSLLILPGLALAAPQFGGFDRAKAAEQLEARFKQLFCCHGVTIVAWPRSATTGRRPSAMRCWVSWCR